MSIIKAIASDFIEVWYLLEVNARANSLFGYFKGIDIHETHSLLESGLIWLYRNENDVCLGTLVFMDEASILIENNGLLSNPMYIKYFALYPYFKHPNTEPELMQFARNYASEYGYSHLVFSKGANAIPEIELLKPANLAGRS